jgi:3-methyladenine DNA glycosylase AlkD
MLPLTQDIKTALEKQADAKRATQMQAYMKSAMPFYGVPAPTVTKICQSVFKANPIDTQVTWHAAILDLWREATHREQRYVAENLAGVKRFREFQSPKSYPMYREIIVDGAWWDLVDGVVHRLGEILVDYPKAGRKKMTAWMNASNLWQRRAAILCQLKLKDSTNEDLLFTAIEVNMHDQEFFIRKAIGWALRNHAKTNPQTVVSFVSSHASELSPLSKKEALRILLKDGLIDTIP